ncbi:endo-1,4-beta-xylanase [Terribacillus halophilus]|uniref:endo-1,4-beta-xylanase n=1 Tax=Terribacillus halophilus TaxID=361279 RepID=UPI00098766CB|nr:endo-1,4-beta-xylanase [Terribacillus halophilus]
MKKRKWIWMGGVILLIGIALGGYMMERQTLRKLADDEDLRIGSSIQYDALMEDTNYQELATTEFSSWTIENEMKMDAMQPEEGAFNYVKVDKMIEMAQEHDIEIRGHVLVWGEALPAWVQDQAVDRASAERILKSHVQNIVKQYKGRIDTFDVVNEAWHDNGTLRDTIWLRTIGPDYIPLAFQWAHEANPDAKLYYNDFGTEMSNEKSEAMLEALSAWKEEGVPIDGIGTQMHLDAADPRFSKDRIAEWFKRIEDAGFQIAVTEMDVKLQNLNNGDAKNIQAERYGDVMEICLDTAACEEFTVWGISDNYSWVTEQESAAGKPLLFNENSQPKKAYHTIKRKLLF